VVSFDKSSASKLWLLIGLSFDCHDQEEQCYKAWKVCRVRRARGMHALRAARLLKAHAYEMYAYGAARLSKDVRL
jgi:hypothetical protein